MFAMAFWICCRFAAMFRSLGQGPSTPATQPVASCAPIVRRPAPAAAARRWA